MPERRWAIATPHTAATAAGGPRSRPAGMLSTPPRRRVRDRRRLSAHERGRRRRDGARARRRGARGERQRTGAGGAAARAGAAARRRRDHRARRRARMGDAGRAVGVLPLSRALPGAAALAHAGVPVAPSLARTAADCAELIAADAGLAGCSRLEDGSWQRATHSSSRGSALTLERLAAHGADDLYARRDGDDAGRGPGRSRRADRARRSRSASHRRLPRATPSGRRRGHPDDGTELAGATCCHRSWTIVDGRDRATRSGAARRYSRRSLRDGPRIATATWPTPLRCGSRSRSCSRTTTCRAGTTGAAAGGVARTTAGDRRHHRAGRRRRLGPARLAHPEHLLRVRIGGARAADGHPAAQPRRVLLGRSREPERARARASGRCTR